MKNYTIYTNAGEQLTVEAANIRKALKAFTGRPEDVVGCFVSDCLPSPTEQSGPVVAVILKNPHFVPPPVE